MFELFKKKSKWIGNTPDKGLWRTYKKNTNYKQNNYSLKVLEFQDLMNFGRSQLFNLSLNHYSLQLQQHGIIQTIQKATSHGENLVKLMSNENFKYEHMQIVVHTKCKDSYLSPIIKGKKNRVSNTNQILSLIMDQRNKLERYAKEISHISILHTHPSLEVMIIEKDNTKVNFQALSPADIKILKQVQSHFKWPITLSAITPSGIQYTCIKENILAS